MSESSTSRITRGRFLIAAGVIGLLILLTITVPATAEEIKKAPLSPAFTGLSNGKMASFTDYPLGYQRGPLDLSILSGEKYYPVPPSLPERFDLRELGKVSPVKDQGRAGSCWVFATYGSLESTLLPEESRDFSENHVKNTLSSAYTWGFDRGPLDGGGALTSTAYLARWSGPVNEADDPYVWNSTWSPEVLPVQKHLTDMIFLPTRSGPLDNGQIKVALMRNGAMFIAYEHEDGREGDIGNFYNETYHSYYYNGPFGGNHAVTLVGWDDTFPASHFSFNNTPNPPPGDGAFIVKNSWGPKFGENGFFYISYYDTTLGMANTSPYFDTNEIVQFMAESPDDYDHVYQHDPFGLIDLVGTGSNDTLWGANIFVANGTEDIKAVGFYSMEPWSSYQVRVYKGGDGTQFSTDGPGVLKSQDPASVTSGTIDAPGYHVIPLAESVRVREGQGFLVMLRITTPHLKYPLGVEYAQKNYSSHAWGSGMGYVSVDGNEWTDIRTALDDPTVDICLKAFTGDVQINPVPAITGISPSKVQAGANGFTLHVYGNGFVNGSQIWWNNLPLTTTMISPYELSALVSREKIAAGGDVPVIVISPPEGGGPSNSFTFIVSPLSPGGLPYPAFSASPRSGSAPLSVTFTDESTGFPDRWYWIFGDGAVSHEQNPTHVYQSPGTYPVTLRVWNTAGSARKVFSGYITVPG